MTFTDFELSNFFNQFFNNFKNGLYEFNSNNYDEQKLFEIFKKALRIKYLQADHSQIKKFPNEFKDKVYETFKNFYKTESNLY